MKKVLLMSLFLISNAVFAQNVSTLPAPAMPQAAGQAQRQEPHMMGMNPHVMSPEVQAAIKECAAMAQKDPATQRPNHEQMRECMAKKGFGRHPHPNGSIQTNVGAIGGARLAPAGGVVAPAGLK